MSKGNFPACCDVTLAYEGGLSMEKADPGNWTGGKVGVGVLKGTKYGIDAASHPGVDIVNLTVTEARTIYEAKYWTPVRGELLPAGVDLVTYDYGVNSGTGRSSRDLQSVVGVWSDGIIGPDTLKAIAAADGKTTIQKLCAKRLGYLQALKIWNTFKRGWSSRVASVEAKGVAMFLAASPAVTPAAARQSLMDESTSAQAKASKQQATAGGTAAAGGGSVVVPTDHHWYLIAGAVLLVVVVAGVLITLSHHNKARADAYAAEADKAAAPEQATA